MIVVPSPRTSGGGDAAWQRRGGVVGGGGGILVRGRLAASHGGGRSGGVVCSEDGLRNDRCRRVCVWEEGGAGADGEGNMRLEIK